MIVPIGTPKANLHTHFLKFSQPSPRSVSNPLSKNTEMFEEENDERERERGEPGRAHAQEEEEFGEDITGAINGERDWPTMREVAKGMADDRTELTKPSDAGRKGQPEAAQQPGACGP